MTLYKLTAQLFLFLVSFRRKISKGIPVSIPEMRSQLYRIFDEQEAMARREMRMEQLYKRVKYPLTALADEILLISNWEHAAEWKDELLEKKFFDTSIAGYEFFKQAEELLRSNLSHKDDIEVAQIFYVCLCLGFKGKYDEGDEAPHNLRLRLYRYLPESIPPEETKLTPEAYHITPTTGKKLQPVVNLVRVAIVCIGFCILYLIINQALWYETIDAIHRVVEETIGK
ncbi:MAG: DotU family type IV/VI secretion system protein [bacterium]